jgi:7,8-dihydropterin-6-yl-methyl-4-(beta-D-ribofuranosyl)aminobenzene 5'-phosphate synthase
MRMMNINPQDIEIVVISHIHGDHLGGLGGFLRINPRVTVYLPASFPSSIKEEVRCFGAECRSVDKAVPIVQHVFSTGEMGTWIKEQSVVLDTRRGIIVITGCAHPGIVNIIKKAKAILPNKPVHLAMGGFHLGGLSDSKLRGIIKEFRNLGVEKAGPCHCSGDRCRELFAEEYDRDYVDMGVGRVMAFED